MKSFPDLYPEFKCPLCHDGVGEDFHIFCQCPDLDEARSTAVSSCTAALNEKLGEGTLSEASVKFCLFPQSQGHFKNGLIHGEMRRKIRQRVGRTVDTFAGQVGRVMSAAYHDVWSRYTNLLVERKVTLNDRLKATFDTTSAQIRRVWDTG